jgi:hypothetical protein
VISERSGTARHPAVFVIGALALVALWLPALADVQTASIPDFCRNLLVRLRVIRFDEGMLCLRWDYLIIPVLLIWAVWITWKSRPSLKECGLDFSHFFSALKYLALPTILGALLLLLIGLGCKSIDIEPRFWKRFLLNSAIFQQFVLQVFFHRQLMPWFGAGRRTAVYLTLYFVALHEPNPGLVLGTLIGMYFWARCYQRFPNLYALAISQALLSALLMHTLPRTLLPSVSVGLRFVEKVF